MYNKEHRIFYFLGRIMMLVEFYKEGKIDWIELRTSIESELMVLVERIEFDRAKEG